jgi:PAT family beta-lactamase induction signal transducer AmpG
MLVLLAFLAATHDVAIDAYYMEGLPDRSEQAKHTGLRVTAYRMAVLFAKFGLVALPTWTWGFGAGAGVMAALALFHFLAAPRFASDTGPDDPDGALFAQVGRAVTSYLQQPRIWVVVPFITLYKLGDELLFAMNSTFLKRELHVTNAQLAWLSGLVGTVTSIAGAMLGAWWIKRVGLKRAIWPLTLLMNLNIWAYVWLAVARPDAGTSAGMAQIAFIHGYEQVAAGLGSAALTVFLLYTCKPEHKAAHYAFGSAIMSLTGTLFGGFSGTWVEAHGYTSLYVLSFLGSIPSMVLLRFVPIPEPEKTVAT